LTRAIDLGRRAFFHIAMGWLRTFTLFGWTCWLLALVAGTLISWIMARALVRLMG
jgi:hypothetical protein